VQQRPELVLPAPGSDLQHGEHAPHGDLNQESLLAALRLLPRQAQYSLPCLLGQVDFGSHACKQSFGCWVHWSDRVSPFEPLDVTLDLIAKHPKHPGMGSEIASRLNRFSRIATVLQVGEPTPLLTFGRARTCASAPMHAAATVLHGRASAGCSAASLCATAWSSGRIARRIAVSQRVYSVQVPCSGCLGFDHAFHSSGPPSTPIRVSPDERSLPAVVTVCAYYVFPVDFRSVTSWARMSPEV